MSGFLPPSTNVPLFWPKIEFSLFLIGQIFSIPCYLFVFYHILFPKISRKSFHNHSIFILLFYNFLNATIDLSLTQNFNRLGYVNTFHPLICLIWQYINYGIWYGGVSMMLWLSIERYIFVFHSNFVDTTRKRILFHYIPLFIFAFYTPILFFYLIFLLSCDRQYNQMKIRCGAPCFYTIIPNWFSLYDSFVNYTIAILLIAVFSITIFFRFINQKRKLKRTITWRQSRKMLIQLFFVSTIYILFDLPYVIIFIVRQTGYTTFGDNVTSPYITRLTFVPSIILPYAVLFGLPTLKQKLNALCFWKKF